MSLYSSLLKNTIILTISIICTRIVSFIMIPFFSRWLSVEDYGTFDLFCIYVAILVPLLSFSAGEGVFRKIIDAGDEKTKCFTSLMMILFVVAFVCLAFFSFPVFHLYNEKLYLPFWALATGELFSYLLTNYARGKKKIAHYAISSFIFVCSMSALVTLFVFKFKMALPGILYGYALAFFIESFYLILSTKVYRDIDFHKIDKKSFKELMAYSIPLVPNKISWNVVNVISRTLILFFLGAVANGVYAIASKIPTICTALFSAFHLSWQESAVDALNDDKKNDFFNGIYNKSISVVLSICVIILSFNHFLFTYIFDIKYHEAVYFSPILIAAMIFSFLSQFISSIFNAYEETKINGVSTLYATILNVLLCFIFIRWWGLYAVAVSTLVAYLFLYLYRVVNIKKYVKLEIKTGQGYSIIIYVTYSIIQYVDYMPLHICSSVFAGLFFIYVNQGLFKKILSKVKRA